MSINHKINGNVYTYKRDGISQFVDAVHTHTHKESSFILYTQRIKS